MKRFNILKRQRARGMTLVETLVAMGVFGFVMLALISSQLLGLKEDEFIESQCGASDSSRRALDKLPRDIRSAKGWQIGSYSDSGNNFVAIHNDSNLQGTALKLFPTTLTNAAIDQSKYILYYFDLSDTANSDGRLVRYDNMDSTTDVIASNLINTLYFTAEDYQGNTQTVTAYKNIIHTTLQFCEFQYPKTFIGTNYLFVYYKIDFRMTPHLPDGP